MLIGKIFFRIHHYSRHMGFPQPQCGCVSEIRFVADLIIEVVEFIQLLHHLAHNLGDARNTVILVGFQAEGTRGRRLLEGAKSVKMLGQEIAVSAEVVNVPAFSVHADRSEILDWLRQCPSPPERTFVVHGEPEAAAGLSSAIEEKLGWNSSVPAYLDEVRLD